ncbi:hypothetical protein [Sphingomonas sp. VNH70]|uniref:hypothetical protein n=1 Tax=Sphingomonas silueang TaxID=3156617 RepID=UPI0032B39E77
MAATRQLGRHRLLGQVSAATLAAVRIAFAALAASPVGHDLTVPGDLGQSLGFLDRPELLRVTPMLLGQHAVAEGWRAIPIAEPLAGAGVLALFPRPPLGAGFARNGSQTEDSDDARKYVCGANAGDEILHGCPDTFEQANPGSMAM